MKRIIILAAVAMIVGCVQPQPTEQSGNVVQNPVINSVTANPSVVPVGQNCVVTCNAYDPQGNSLTYKWKVLLGDIVGHGSTVRYSAAYCCAGINTIEVTVTNPQGGSAKGSVDVEVTRP